jgi:nifR3 family TIM-barrel protein
VESAVKAAGEVPLTIKMRTGIDSDHLTYLEAAKAAEGAGVASIALHARTASEFYSGQADWSAIARLKAAISDVPVLGNGDIWSGADAIRMVEQTGCDGVVVGRGCLGRPWLFGDLVAAFQVRAGELTAEEAAARQARPTLGVVAATLRRHAELLAELLSSEGDDGQVWACRDIRKHVSWYFKGYPVGSELRSALARVESFQQLDDLLGELDLTAPYPGEDAEGPRGRAGHPKRTVLPEGWLDSRELAAAHRGDLTEGEADTTGG